MIRKILVLYGLCILSPLILHGQITGFADDFEDGSLDTTWEGSAHTLWSTQFPQTYSLNERNGQLDIGYLRDAQTDPDASFQFYPPAPINVRASPRIVIEVKKSQSGTPAEFMLETIYSTIPTIRGRFEQEIPGDGQWHTYTFLLEEENYSGRTLQTLSLYFDRGIAEGRVGTISFDNLKVAGISVQISEIETNLIDKTSVELTWATSDPERVDHYNIYRHTQSGFEANEELKIGQSESTIYLDEDLQNYSVYYYRVTAVDTVGEEYLPSQEIRQETYTRGITPVITVRKENTDTPGKYEKFEVLVSLDNVVYDNPYNPDDINIYAVFESPDGDSVRINGFYDNYQNRDQWKVRFSPDVTGVWRYRVYAEDVSGTGDGEIRSFTVTESPYHGWIRPSETNPHYLIHDDGTSYYGVGVYSPWGNNQDRFDTYSMHDANLFAIWNINYGGFINNYSVGVIENDLGRYNQEKLGRIDSLVSIMEEKGVKIMYCIWPHDLFSASVWATAWDINPYRHLIGAEEVYGDSLVWEYQKKLYRYLIARYGYSRSLGIWEIINEMNGTDGWQQGHTNAAFNWVRKVDRYFEEHDPYGHPTTASFSGGLYEYRPRLYQDIDLPNLHLYEGDWPMEYPDDAIRSSIHNYGWASRRFWNNFEKPAIFGESGADHTYVDADSPEYSVIFHNALWASLANGLAAAPVWWQYPHLGELDWDNLQHFSHFVSGIDFANLPFGLTTVTAEGADAFGLEGDSAAFGWLRTYTRERVEGTDMILAGLETGSFQVVWYNTWSGDTVRIDTSVAAAGEWQHTVPSPDQGRKDMAFSAERIGNGTVPEQLNLFIAGETGDVLQDSVYRIVCYVSDSGNRLVPEFSREVTFTLTGPGNLSENTITLRNGVGTVTYELTSPQSGGISIRAESDELSPANLHRQLITDITSETSRLPDRFALEQNYPNPFNPVTRITYTLPRTSTVTLRVFDVAGHLVRTLIEEEARDPGQHEILFNGGDLSSGIYFYQINAGSFTAVKRMVVLR